MRRAASRLISTRDCRHVMARTPTITDEQILEAARALFIERGLDVPTSEIAALAAVSEGTIFKRFQTKENLFVVAMQRSMSRAPWLERLDERCGRGELREQLTLIAHDVLDELVVMIARIHMILAHHAQLRDELLGHPDSPPGVALKRLTHFFDHEQRLGRLSGPDAELLARVFLGALHHYCFAERIGLNARMPMPQATYVRGVVALILDGAAPPSTLSSQGDSI